MRYTARDEGVTSLTVYFTGGGTRTLDETQLRAGFAARNKQESLDLDADPRLVEMETPAASSGAGGADSKENE